MNPVTQAAAIAIIRDIASLCGEDEQLLADMLEAETDLHSKLGYFARRRIRAQADAKGAKAAKAEAMAHYDNRIAIAEREAEHCDKIIRLFLEAAGLSKIALPEAKISIIPGRASVVTEDGFNLQGYMRQPKTPPPEPDKIAIKEALERGEQLPGAELVIGQPTVRIA